MFDIGFWELGLIAVVALLVVGPKEFPAMVRTMRAWIKKIRGFINEAKTEIDREFTKVDELKKLMAKEAGIAELHKNIDTSKPAVRQNNQQLADDSDKPQTQSATDKL